MYRQCKTFISFFWSFGGIYLFHFMIINSYHSIIIFLKVIKNSCFTYCWLYDLFRSWSFPFPIPCQILPTSLSPYQPNFLFFLSFSQTHPTSQQSNPPQKIKKTLKDRQFKKEYSNKTNSTQKAWSVAVFLLTTYSWVWSWPALGCGWYYPMSLHWRKLVSLSQQESIAQSFLVRGVVPSLPFPFQLSVLGFGLVWTCAGLCALPQLLWVQMGISPAVSRRQSPWSHPPLGALRIFLLLLLTAPWALEGGDC